MPAIIFSSVLLPEPEGPTTAQRWPRGKWAEISRSSIIGSPSGITPAARDTPRTSSMFIWSTEDWILAELGYRLKSDEQDSFTAGARGAGAPGAGADRAGRGPDLVFQLPQERRLPPDAGPGRGQLPPRGQ